jgi:hypothetical protein
MNTSEEQDHNMYHSGYIEDPSLDSPQRGIPGVSPYYSNVFIPIIPCSAQVVDYNYPFSNHQTSFYVPSVTIPHNNISQFINIYRATDAHIPIPVLSDTEEDVVNNCDSQLGPGPPIITSDVERGPYNANLFVFHLPAELTNWDLYLLFRYSITSSLRRIPCLYLTYDFNYILTCINLFTGGLVSFCLFRSW